MTKPRTAPTPPEPVASAIADGEGLIEEIAAEMDGRQRGYADVRGELLFRCRDRIAELQAELSQANANGASHWSRATQAEARADRLAKALERIKDLETRPHHDGYDNGPGGGNYIYRDVVFTDEVFPIIDEALREPKSGGGL